ncbi:MAG: DUF362 domain-containing protein [Candidatus Aminicenantes bacterium]|nr:DUF362 domain-containing protein [Candidatus Aminicenantes bacterium]
MTVKKSRVFFVPARGTEPAEDIARKAKEAYLATGFNEKLEPEDFTALKIHFGEKQNAGYIKPAWLTHILHEILKRTKRAFLTDSNTLYVGSRSNSVDHIRLAWEHGFTPNVVGVPVIIADGLVGRDKHETVGAGGPVSVAKIASAILSSDALLCLSHVTGHVQTGIGAAIKNLGMGCASRAGKLDQHAVVHPRVSAKECRNCSLCMEFCPEKAVVQAEGHVVIDDARCIGCGECLVVCKWGAVKMRWDSDSRRIQEKLATYARLVQKHFGRKSAFVNFLIKITKDCDCMAKEQPAVVDDIGLLASTDPVAVDKATADLVVERAGKDVFRTGYDVDWSVQLTCGEKIGLGTTRYELVTLD